MLAVPLFFGHAAACERSAPQTASGPGPTTVKALSLNHWIARESLEFLLDVFFIL